MILAVKQKKIKTKQNKNLLKRRVISSVLGHNKKAVNFFFFFVYVEFVFLCSHSVLIYIYMYVCADAELWI